MYFPIFVQLKNKKIIIIGGGNIAFRRLNVLLDFECKIKVISDRLCDNMIELYNKNLFIYENRKYQFGDCEGAFLVIAATSDRNVNQNIAKECDNKHIFVSVADKKEESTFYFPAIAKKDNIVIGINSNGIDYKKTKNIAQDIRNILKLRS